MRLVYTREPGSWVMFVVAFAAGAAVAGGAGRITAAVFASLALLLAAKAPVSRLLRGGGRDALVSVAALALPGAACVLYALMSMPVLAWLYLAGGAMLVLYFTVPRKALVFQEAAGMAVMGLAAAMAASASSGEISRLYLWPMFFAFYLSSSFRVRGGRYRLLSGLYSGALAASGLALALYGMPLFLPFLPLLEDVYAALRGGRPPFRRLGMIESAKAVAFAALLIALAP